MHALLTAMECGTVNQSSAGSRPGELLAVSYYIAQFTYQLTYNFMTVFCLFFYFRR